MLYADTNASYKVRQVQFSSLTRLMGLASKRTKIHNYY